MKNYLLGNSTSLTPYYKEMNNYTGSVTATLLMTQLEYWFSKTDGEMFFKFLEPCDRKDYKVGDSWTEELGFSKYEFRTAFEKIGKVYKSKSEYVESENKFEDKYYLSYYDRMERRTYYARNHEKVDEMIEHWISRKSVKSTYRSGECQLIEVDKVHLEKLEKSTSNNSRLLQETTTRERGKSAPAKIIKPEIHTKVKHGDFVKLKKEEYEKLVDEFGKDVILEYIEKLNNYIGSSGKRYKSHYHTIRNWLSRDKIKPSSDPGKGTNAQDQLNADLEEFKNILGMG